MENCEIAKKKRIKLWGKIKKSVQKKPKNDTNLQTFCKNEQKKQN